MKALLATFIVLMSIQLSAQQQHVADCIREQIAPITTRFLSRIAPLREETTKLNEAYLLSSGEEKERLRAQLDIFIRNMHQINDEYVKEMYASSNRCR